jgi:hypothetical protein
MYTQLYVSFSLVNVGANRQHNGHREDIPLPVNDNAAQGQPQDLRYIDMAYYDIAHPRAPPAVSSIYPLDMLPSHE